VVKAATTEIVERIKLLPGVNNSIRSQQLLLVIRTPIDNKG